MATISTSTQYKFTGAGPLDAKSLVKTYADLINLNTWCTSDGIFTAYNGMIVAVWLNLIDTSKNGIYFLHDENVTTGRGKPDVTNEKNWHKLGAITDMPGLSEQISARIDVLEGKITTVEEEVNDLQEVKTEVGNFNNFPKKGVANKLYIDLDTAIAYVWHEDDEKYVPVGDGDTQDVQYIRGGNASGN